jgi:hypothetical protein
MGQKINLQMIYQKTLITVLQKIKKDARKEDRTIVHQFTVPDPGLIHAVAPNISGDYSSFDCFTLMFTNELFNHIVIETNRNYQQRSQEEEKKTLQPDVTLF